MSRRGKILTGSIVLLLVAVSAGAAVYLTRDSKDTKQGAQTMHPAIAQLACELFSLTDAKRLLGDSAEQIKTETVAEPNKKDIPPPVPEVKTGAFQNQPTDQIVSSTFDDSGAKQKQDPSDSSVCNYSRNSEKDTSKNTILISVLGLNETEAKKNFDAMEQTNTQQITGYGEKAFWKTGKDASGISEYGQLVVLQKGGVITISGGAGDLELSKKIAKTIEGNLHD